MKKLIAIILIPLIVIGGFWGHKKYEEKKYFDTVVPLIKNTSLRVANAARYETESNSNVTFKELFSRIESDVAEIDKRLLEVQTIATADNKEHTDLIVRYMATSQTFLRALEAKYRKVLALNSATNIYESYWKDFMAHPGDRSYLSRSLDNARDAKSKGQREYVEAILNLKNSMIELKRAKSEVATLVPTDAIVSDKILDEVIKENTTEVEAEEKTQAKNPPSNVDTTNWKPEELARAKNCLACHASDKKLVGPAFKDVGKRYANQSDAREKLTNKIIIGGKGVWGEIPMPPNNVTRDEAEKLAVWVLQTK